MTQLSLDSVERDRNPSDRAASDQITQELTRTLFVEAGAGTGKTRALVDRIVALVLAGTDVERIAAITFTEKAAAELCDRVRSGLEASLSSRGADAERVARAIDSLDRAQISTIHAFALRELRFFAAEAGVDPDFRVLDELQAQRRRQERWRIFLEELAADPEAVDAFDRVLALGLRPSEIEQLVAELSARQEIARLLEDAASSVEAPTWPNVESLAAELQSLVQRGPQDELRRRVERLRDLLRRLPAAAAGEREALLGAAGETLGLKFGVGRKADWDGEVDKVRTAAQRARDKLLATLAACRARALAGLLPYLIRFVREDGEERAREGDLTFDDLILRTHDLLRERADAARSLRQRYEVLLIDEFQDTDPLQVDIALAFATEPGAGRIEQGRLFLVGDPKQSIYRFRRADMAVYAHTRGAVEAADGGFPQLSMNRRSRGVVLAWVNAVFAGMIGPGADLEIQPAYQPVFGDRSADLHGPGVAFMGGSVSGMNAGELRRMEARQLAAQCRAALEEGWQVEDGGATRPAAYRDIAILMPTRGLLGQLERALGAHNIPYRVEGGSLIYRTQEVRDLINCLAAIDDPADEVAIVAALRSPAFTCSDVDLARYRASGGRLNYLSPDIETRDGPVGDGLRILSGYHESRHDGSLAALVERLALERGLIEAGMLDRGDRNSFRRARFVIEQARAFEEGGPESLRSFVSWMERRTAEVMLDQEGAALDDDEDAVRVLTIHAAKGLEFPIVFVAGLGASPNRQGDALYADRDAREAAVAIGSKERRFVVGPADSLSRREDEHDRAEAARLLYVATTRPRDHLVVCLYHSERAKQCAARRLIEHGAREQATPLPERDPGPPVARRPFEDLDVAVPDITVDEFESGRGALLVAARTRRYTSATALGREAKDEATDATEPWARGRGGTRIGRAVHATIQSLPLDADEASVRAFARAQAVAEAVPERASEVERLVRAARASEAAARARTASRALREVPFALSLDGVVLEGFVDLVIEGPDGLEIVDWKTDDVSKGEVAERLQEYALQAGLYVLGLERATSRPITCVTYVFVRPGIEVSPGEPAALREAALARLTGNEPAPHSGRAGGGHQGVEPTASTDGE